MPITARPSQRLKQLDRGEEHGAVFWVNVAREYNDASTKHGSLAYPLDWTTTPNNPAHFAPMTAAKCRASYKKLFKDYDDCFQRWKKSGHHGGLPIPEKPFSDFMNVHVMEYIHHFAQEHPGIVSTVTKSLEADVFSESTSVKGRGKRKSANSKQSSPLDSTKESMGILAESSVERTKAIAYAIALESHLKTRESLNSMRDRRRNLIKEAGGKDEFKDLKESDSQSSIADEVAELDVEIKDMKEGLTTLKTKIKAYEQTEEAPVPTAAA